MPEPKPSKPGDSPVGPNDAQQRAEKINGPNDAQQRAEDFVRRLIGAKPVDAQDQVQDHGRVRLTDTTGTARGPQQGGKKPR